MKTWILFYLVVFTMFTVPAQQSFLQKAHADTITWDGNGDGINWSDPSNWASDALPQSGDNIIIPLGSDVTLDISFSLSGSLYVESGATLTINQLDALENDIHFTLSSATVTNEGTITSDGKISGTYLH